MTIEYLFEDDDILSMDIFKNKVKNKKGETFSGKQRADIFNF